MKTFQQFKEESEKKFKNTMNSTAKEIVSPLEKFAKSGKAQEILQQSMGLLFNKIDKAVEGGNKKYNEFKNKVNR